MASLIWNPACTTGVQAIDDQHGILLDALNELRVELLHGAETRTVRAMLRRVTELMRLHLDSEERLLERNGFPGLAAHRVEHQQLMGRLAVMDVQYESWRNGSAYELVEYLRKWFTAHTGSAGQSYAPWLREAKVQ